MVKNLKINIKNAQIADALNISKVKAPKKKAAAKKSTASKDASKSKLASSSKKPKVRIMRTPTGSNVEEVKEEEIVEEKVAPELEEAAAPEVSADEATTKEQAPKEATEKEEKKTATAEKTASTKSSKPKRSPEKPENQEKQEKGDKKDHSKKGSGAFKEFRDFRAIRRKEQDRGFDARDRQGLRNMDDEGWRKRRPKHKKKAISQDEIAVVRPKSLTVRLPITIKDLAAEMKLKASELVAKLFMQGITRTLNDFLDDETTVQLLGHEFQCEITIDTTEEERLRITDKTIQEEISETPKDDLKARAPIITFMGHVDHGKTSLIDAIRKSSIAAGETGDITQHIGAFVAHTPTANITILDTPGHEAFSEMRQRGANVTDIVVLVVAGDEGIRDQTKEAVMQAKEAKVPIVVAINKSDKDGFDEQKIFRELSEIELLPEAWGGTTLTVSCSAHTGAGIKDLLELVMLQAEVQELRANPKTRARGTVLESEMHKGLGAVATVLVQNGTLEKNDAIVFGDQFGRIKTMHDEHGKDLENAPPSTPVKITGLSGLAEAGFEFIVVKNEKEAKNLAEARKEDTQRILLQSKKGSLENLLQQTKESGEQKVLPLIINADVQGSLEALKNSLFKIKTNKARIEIVSEGVGGISESDIELAAASKATILGFHTKVESHAESLIKQNKVKIHLHDIIYHAIDDVKELMKGLLDKIEEESDTGSAEVQAIFKSSHLGIIAGCIVKDGSIHRNHRMRQLRDGEEIWKGKIASIKRVKEEVKEVQKGVECGIILDGQKDVQVGDVLQAYEIIYHEQEL